MKVGTCTFVEPPVISVLCSGAVLVLLVVDHRLLTVAEGAGMWQSLLRCKSPETFQLFSISRTQVAKYCCFTVEQDQVHRAIQQHITIPTGVHVVSLCHMHSGPS